MRAAGRIFCPWQLNAKNITISMELPLNCPAAPPSSSAPGPGRPRPSFKKKWAHGQHRLHGRSVFSQTSHRLLLLKHRERNFMMHLVAQGGYGIAQVLQGQVD